MSLIVRQLKEYHTNRSAAFAGTRCYYLDQVPVDRYFSIFEIASNEQLWDYCFFLNPRGFNSADIKRMIRHTSVPCFIEQQPDLCLRWDKQHAIELDWSNPPKERRLAIVVQIRHGQPDFSAPALFMYVPKAVKKPRMRHRLKPLPKGTGPIPYRM